MITCTRCGLSWEVENAKKGFYTWKGRLQQPCKECRKDTSSQRYYNDQLGILQARYDVYHSPEHHEAKKAYHRDYYHSRQTA